jgi:NADH-quinone oxidoreductase subunit N
VTRNAADFAGSAVAGWVTVAVLGLVASYLGIYLYLRVIQYLFMSPAPERSEAVPAAGIARTAAVLMLAAVLLIGVLPGLVLGWF